MKGFVRDADCSDVIFPCDVGIIKIKCCLRDSARGGVWCAGGVNLFRFVM